MNERLLQFIWQYQYFSRSELQTVTGEKIEIILPGMLNTNQGPDFLNSKIRVGNTLLAGHVELHINTSQWLEHGHHKDRNYNGVILHVVFEHDLHIHDNLPVLELQPYISTILTSRYQQLMDTAELIPCASAIKSVREIIWTGWKDRLIAERLTRKSVIILQLLQGSKGHWEEVLWWLLARNFGIKVNADAFESMARSIPLTVLGKHKNQIHQLEALLFGQSGLLSGTFNDEYARLLQREYQFLQKKYNLKKIDIPIHFLRMRPGNFPTIRLAQMAMLLHRSIHLFATILETENSKELRKLFAIEPNDYWLYHYLFDDQSPFKNKKLGADMVSNLLINTIIPVLFAYGSFHQIEKYKQKAMKWLEETPAESNYIIKEFKSFGVKTNSSFDSQAVIELKNQYCRQKRCLECAVGNAVLKPG